MVQHIRSVGARRVRVFLAALVIGVAGLGATGCGASSDGRPSKDSSTVTAEVPTPTKRQPVPCMTAVLSDVEQRGPDLWRGTNNTGGFVRVRRFSTAAEAYAAVRAAQYVVAGQAGRYAVLGTFKGADDGATPRIAACLRAHGT